MRVGIKQVTPYKKFSSGATVLGGFFSSLLTAGSLRGCVPTFATLFWSLLLQSPVAPNDGLCLDCIFVFYCLSVCQKKNRPPLPFVIGL